MGADGILLGIRGVGALAFSENKNKRNEQSDNKDKRNKRGIVGDGKKGVKLFLA